MDPQEGVRRGVERSFSLRWLAGSQAGHGDDYSSGSPAEDGGSALAEMFCETAAKTEQNSESFYSHFESKTTRLIYSSE
jgi:hypothetical protein